MLKHLAQIEERTGLRFLAEDPPASTVTEHKSPQFSQFSIRPATPEDDDDLWVILEPVIRAGETYALPRDMPRSAALSYWRDERHEVFVAEDSGGVVGTFFLQPNQSGGGAHVANCGYVTAVQATGRGVASAMCEYSMEIALRRGFLAMQFNFVLATNERAVRLWLRHGFQIVGRLPEAFLHPTQGYVDALIMHRSLHE